MAEQIIPEMQDITRQRDMAKLLLQKGMADNLQGQMVSGRYVGASPWQGIANMYAAYTGNQMAKEADRKQAELAQMLRQQTMQDIQAYGEAITPRAGVEAKPEVIPQGQTALDDQGVPTMGYQAPTEAIPEKKADYSKGLAVLLGSKSPQSQALGNVLLADMFKTQKLGEGEQLVRLSPSGAYEAVGGMGGVKLPNEIKSAAIFLGLQNKDPNTWTAQERLAIENKANDFKRAGANNLVVNTGQSYTSAFGKGIAEQDLNKFTAAQGAPKQLESAQQTLNLLDKGAITGLGANYKLNLARALNVVGANNDEIIKNTEQLVANRGQAVLNNIKTSGLGAGQGFTDKDRQFLENVVGGTITLNDKTLRDLANIEIKTARALADSWNSRVSSIPKEALAGSGIGRVELPNISAPKAPSAPPAPPKVGEVVDGYEFRGGNPADPKNYRKVGN